MSSRRRRIAAILPLELEYSGRLLEGAVQYAEEHRGVTLVDLPYPVDRPAELPLRQLTGFDAALIWATAEARWVERLIAAGIPLISASGDWPLERVPRITFDATAAVEAAVTHLVRRRPAVLVNLEYFATGIPSKEARMKMFCEAAQRCGIPFQTGQIFRKDGSDDSALARRQPLQGGAARRLLAFLRKLPRPAGIWCGDDTLGLRVCEAAASLGLRVPDDVAVLGFGDFRVAASGSPPLSSIPLPAGLIGFRAFSVLNERLSGKTGFPQHIQVTPPAVVVRESTGGRLADDPLEKALSFIRAHAATGVSVSEIAAAVSLSPQALHDRFLKKLGRAPGMEIRNARASAAKRHLADPRLSIARVAHLCGFNQQSKFTNFFRRETGMSPRTWRQANG